MLPLTKTAGTGGFSKSRNTHRRTAPYDILTKIRTRPHCSTLTEIKTVRTPLGSLKSSGWLRCGAVLTGFNRTAPHRTAPHRTATYRNAPHRNVPQRTAPHRTAPHRNAPHRTAPHRTAPHRTALYRIMLRNNRLIVSHLSPSYSALYKTLVKIQSVLFPQSMCVHPQK